MAKKGFGFNHWVPAKPRNKRFPFTYKIAPVPEAEVPEYLEANEPDVEISIDLKDNLMHILRDELTKIFPFAQYLDVNSPDFLGPNPTKNPLKYIIKVEVYVVEKYVKKSGKGGKRSVLAKTWALEVDNFASEYQFNLIRSIEQLEELLKPDHERMSYDLEATGLHPINDYIVGACFAFERKIGYYAPIKHDEEFDDFNLGKIALDMLYEKMCRTGITDMFNARFDMRLMEFTDEAYDMELVNVMDGQITTWYADPDYKQHALKPLAQRFNGYYRPDLSHTMKNAGIDGFNVGKIHPENILFYGAMDGIDTLELGLGTYQFHKEFGLAGEIDKKLLYVLMDLENFPMIVDMKYLEEQCKLLEPKLAALDAEIHDAIGHINLNSPKQKIALFKEFGLDTGVKTKTKQMSTGKDAIIALVEELEKAGETPPKWLLLLNERAKVDKLYNGFFYPLLVQAKIQGGSVRVNYRNTVAATGRLSSGREELENL